MKKININHPKPSQQQLNKLLEQYQAGRYVDAEKLSLSITQEFPEHQFAWKVLSASLKQMGKINESLVACQKCVQLMPQDSEAHNNLGVMLQQFGRLEEAEVSYREAIKTKPNNAEAHYNLSSMLEEQGRLKEAEASYRKAIALKPDNAEAHKNLGDILKYLYRLDEALACYKKSVSLKPDYAEAHNNLGVILQQFGKLDESETSYNIALNLKPGNEMMLMNRGQIYFDKGKFELSLKDVDNCNNPLSRVRSLICLYALGRTDEIYERIKKNFQLDEMNIALAAFSSFISIKEGKKTANNFCRNPIDFIYYSNLKNHLQNSDLFINKTIKELNTIKTQWEPYNTTTTKGFQSKDLFKSPLIKINELKLIINKEIDSYYLRFKNMSCTFIKNWPSKKNLNSWHVVLKKQGYQASHIHTSAWLSGVIYLKVVPHLKKNEGAIEFSLNGNDYSDANSPKVIFRPKIGDIVLFPSSLHHRTIPFTTDEDRIIISFDLKHNLLDKIWR